METIKCILGKIRFVNASAPNGKKLSYNASNIIKQWKKKIKTETNAGGCGIIFTDPAEKNIRNETKDGETNTVVIEKQIYASNQNPSKVEVTQLI